MRSRIVLAALACICSGTWAANANTIDADIIEQADILSFTISAKVDNVIQTTSLTISGTEFNQQFFTGPVGFNFGDILKPGGVFLLQPGSSTDPESREISDILLLTPGPLSNQLTVTFASDPLPGQGAICIGNCDNFPFETGAAQEFGSIFGLHLCDATMGNAPCGSITVTSDVPGPVVGAGLPGLVAACVGLIALARRRRQQIARPAAR
jgi:hypothetical protein